MNTMTQALRRLILTRQHQFHLTRHDNIPPTLPAPIIPAVRIHGGLNKGDLNDPTVPVVVQVIVTPAMSEGDSLTLYWNDTALDSEIITRDHVVVGQVVFFVYPRDVPIATAHVHYHHTGLIGADETSSHEHTPFPIKLLVPGNPDPDPTTPTVNENLKPLTGLPPSIPADHGPVTVGVPRYANIDFGDVITLSWSGVFITREVTDDEVSSGAPSIHITVDADVVRDNPGIGLVLTYSIHDCVKNWSLFSPKSYIDVEAPGSLHVPTVRDASDNDELDVTDGADVAIQIPVNSNLDVPSSGVLTWTGQPVQGPRLTYTQHFQITQASTRVTLYVPHAQAAALAGSFATVYYDGVRGNVPGRSNRATVSVIGEPVELAKPSLTGVSGDTYDPDQIVGDYQEVIVPAWGFMATGQSVTVLWEGTTASGASVYQTVTVPIQQASQVGRPVSVQVEKRYASALVGGSLRVSYQVEADGQRYDSPALTLTVTGEVVTLPPPETLPAFANGQVDPDQVDATLQVLVKAAGVLQPDDRVTIKWLGEPSASTQPEATFPETGDLSVSIDKVPYITGNINNQVTVSYEARRAGVLLGRSRLLTLTIGEPGQLPWATPHVTDATGETANPWPPIVKDTTSQQNTMTLTINDSRLRPGDLLAIVWYPKDGSETPVWAQVTSGQATADVPAQLLAESLGKQADIAYVVWRDGAVIGTWASLSVVLEALPRTALPTPVIPEAVGGLLDLNTVLGDGSVLVTPWPFMAEGQTFWLRLHALRDDGEDWSTRLEAPFTVQPGEVQTGVRRSLKRPDLLRLENTSPLRLEMKAGLAGTSESESMVFPEGEFEMKQVTLVLPAPRVEGLVDGFINPENIPAEGVKITAAFPQQLEGYWVGAQWVCTDEAASLDFPAQKVTNAQALEFMVPKAVALRGEGAPINAQYKVARVEHGLEQASGPTPVYVGSPAPQTFTEDFSSLEPGSYPSIELGPFLITPWTGTQLTVGQIPTSPTLIAQAKMISFPRLTGYIKLLKPVTKLSFYANTTDNFPSIGIRTFYKDFPRNDSQNCPPGYISITIRPGTTIDRIEIDTDRPGTHITNISWEY